MAKIHKDDVGTKIALSAGVGLCAATLLQIKYSKPNGNEGAWDAILEDESIAYYITQENDLDAVGKWSLQLYVELPDWKGHGDIANFRVYPIL